MTYGDSFRLVSNQVLRLGKGLTLRNKEGTTDAFDAKVAFVSEWLAAIFQDNRKTKPKPFISGHRLQVLNAVNGGSDTVTLISQKTKISRNYVRAVASDLVGRGYLAKDDSRKAARYALVEVAS